MYTRYDWPQPFSPPEKSGAEHGTLGSCLFNNRLFFFILFSFYLRSVSLFFFFLLNVSRFTNTFACFLSAGWHHLQQGVSSPSIIPSCTVWWVVKKLLVTADTSISQGQGNGAAEKRLQHSWSVSGMLMCCCPVSSLRTFLTFKCQIHLIFLPLLHDVSYCIILKIHSIYQLLHMLVNILALVFTDKQCYSSFSFTFT